MKVVGSWADVILGGGTLANNIYKNKNCPWATKTKGVYTTHLE